MTRTDRAIGVVAGVVLGIAIVVVFVFFGSEGTSDAPRISHGATTTTAPPHPKPKPKPSGPKTVTASVTIAGGAPPTSGPTQVVAHQNDRVKLDVSSDGTVVVELLGYGITTTVESGKPSVISFKATKTGNFPLIVSASHIAVAQIRVAGAR